MGENRWEYHFHVVALLVASKIKMHWMQEFHRTTLEQCMTELRQFMNSY